MSHYTSALSFLLVLVLFSHVKIEARESKFFSKAIVMHADTTHHVEPPSPSSSPSPLPSPSPSPAPVEAEINSGYGLYGRDEIPNTSGFTSESFFENKIPTEEFNEKFDKDEFDNSALPSNYNERSYVTVPQSENKEKFNTEEFGNNGLPNNYNERSYEKLTPEEKLFNNNGNFNNENSYLNVKEPQGLSDRTLENGKYQYDLEPKSKYEFDTMEEFEKQEGFQGEYIP